MGADPSVRVCHRFEKDISPTIVLNDKKGYAVPSPFDKKISNTKRDQYYVSMYEMEFMKNAMREVQNQNAITRDKY